MATITGNYVYADPTQWWTLDYTFANSKFTWSVTAHASFTSYWNSIYGLTVNVGGNSYYKGDIDWRNYTPNTVVYSGTTNLSDCTVQNGVVTLSVSGNFYYGTWSADYRSSGSGTCAVDPPTVDALTYSATNKYSNMVVAGRSVITFTMKGTSRTGSTSMSYSLYQDNSVISTTTGTSGTAKTVNVTAPSAGSHTYKYVATDGNGTSTTSGTITIVTYAYTPPAFSSVSAVRWSTGTSSGVASDEGTYCKATANFSQGKVGTTALTTTCTIKVDTYTGTATSGTAIWLGGGNLSADNTYQVTFTLSDGYGNSVVTTDTLTQGGRGIDLIYGNGHYGVAIGQKATANQFDVNMTTRINTGYLETNVPMISYAGIGGKRVMAEYVSSTGNTNGTVKITLPNTTSLSSAMSHYVIDCYSYAGGTSGNTGTIDIWGYTYTDGKWYNCKMSSSGGFALCVRLAYDGTHFCILIGATTTNWKYPQIFLREVEIGYRVGTATAYHKTLGNPANYSISLITSESGITNVTYLSNDCASYCDFVGDGNLHVVGAYRYPNSTDIKPIYRRCLTGTSTSGSYSIGTNWGITMVLNVRVWNTNTGNGDHALTGYYQNNADYFNWYMSADKKTLYLRSGTSYAFGSFVIFVDYI